MLVVLGLIALGGLLVALIVRRGGGPSETAAASAIQQIGYAGSASCASCHTPEYEAWRVSQHEQAMAEATPDRVLGNFRDATFTHGQSRTRFFRRGDEFWVNTEGADGRSADFRVRYTFGVDPLQQYLIEMPAGRLQALSVAWDSRPADAGGQRWFHLYGDEPIPPGDELHWTGRQQNWNFMCADCHSTNVRKGYDPETDRFETTWSAINVGCEACHGPGSNHVEWARASSLRRRLFWRSNGLTAALNDRDGVGWSVDPANGKPVRSAPRTTTAELTACAPCHSRRTQIADGFRPGLPLMDFYVPVTMAPGLFEVDGQQLDEVYTHTSFLQSRMHQAGVTCSDCHDPHSARLRATGNALCTSCHVPARYDTADHHRHRTGSAGAACVACHMPERTYMTVDGRRDHSLRVPRPDQSAALGVPNACTSCHTDQTSAWAAARVGDWLGRDAVGFQNFAPALHADAVGGPDAAARLARLAGDPAQPAIVRATALERLARRPGSEAVSSAMAAAADDDPSVRLAAVRVAEALPARERAALAGPALADPVRAVRLEAARLLAPLAGAIGNAAGVETLDQAIAELRASLRFNFDRPESRLADASILAARGRVAEARAAYQAALGIAPDYAPAYVNFADFLSSQAQESDAERILRDGLARIGPHADLQYALGLSLARGGRHNEALPYLEQAAARAPEVARFGYVFAVALHSTGRRDRAVRVLEQLLERHPTDRDSLFALATFHRDAGRRDLARAATDRLLRAHPDDLEARALAGALR
jgi:predicted CXXCH cytochrome family protein